MSKFSIIDAAALPANDGLQTIKGDGFNPSLIQIEGEDYEDGDDQPEGLSTGAIVVGTIVAGFVLGMLVATAFR